MPRAYRTRRGLPGLSDAQRSELLLEKCRLDGDSAFGSEQAALLAWRRHEDRLRASVNAGVPPGAYFRFDASPQEIAAEVERTRDPRWILECDHVPRCSTGEECRGELPRRSRRVH